MIKSSSFGKGVSSQLGKLFGWVPLTPNQITFLSVLCALAGAGILFFRHDWVFSSILFFLSFALDAVDGAVARARNVVSKKGAFIDGISDRLVEFFFIIAFLSSVWGPDLLSFWSLILILFFGTCMSSFVKAYAEHQNVLSHEAAHALPGMFERAPRTILLILAFLYYGSGDPIMAGYLLAGGAVLSVITFGQRFIMVLLAK